MLTKIECTDCGAENERNHSSCTACGNSLGFPNVNILSDPYFQDALENEYQNVLEKCKTNSISELEIENFEQIIYTDAQAVINLDSKLVFNIVNEKEEYLPYQKAVREKKREKAEFDNDRHRCFVEAAFYGMVGGELSYAALSLDDNGLNSYKDSTLVLNNDLIKSRTTVFKKNSFILFTELLNDGWKISEPIPPGHCGIWKDRANIATIKHGLELIKNNSIDDYTKLILKNTNNRETDEFIELHIFNPINFKTLKKIIYHSKAKSKYNSIQLSILKDNSKIFNIELVEE